MVPLYCSKGHENPSGNRFCRLCGEKLSLPVSPDVSPAPGMVMGGRYRIVRELGHGGFGRTYLAEDLNRFNESCVLKEFAPQVQGTYALQKAEELFEREAGVLYKLQHAQIPKFREMFRVKQGNKGLLFLVQDFVVGQTYHALLEGRKRQGLRFNEAEVTQLLLQILPVLQYIHSMGVIHRDISPDNLILRSTDGLPVLIDFGGVKQVAATVASQLGGHSAAGVPAFATRLGKVGYAPHEQMQGGIAYPHSDLYALGATVLVLLTGKEPQQLIDPNILTWNWRRDINLSPTLGSVLDKMLQPNPSDRFISAAQALEALTTQPAPVTYPPTQAPSPLTEATVAAAPLAVTPPVTPPPPTTLPTPSPSSPDSSSPGWLGKILLVLGVIVVAGGVGWLAGNWWIHSQINGDDTRPQPTDSNPVISPTEEPTPEPSSPFSPEELRRKESLQQRRVALDIRYQFYSDLVNEEFWRQYPDQKGRTLSSEPEDAELRAQWDAIASDLLRRLANLNLSAVARRQLGSYADADLTRAKAEANQLRVSSRSLYDLVDARFFQAFPDEKGNNFLNKPVGQVWQAMVSDTLNALKTKEALERIAFDPEAVSKTVSGTLKPGQGKVFIAELSKSQLMKVNLQTAKSALFSIYTPSGNSTLLEDSRDRSWSGELSETGIYEFVVVSESSGAINYQLDLTVENPASPEPSPEETQTPEPSPVESPS